MRCTMQFTGRLTSVILLLLLGGFLHYMISDLTPYITERILREAGEDDENDLFDCQLTSGENLTALMEDVIKHEKVDTGLAFTVKRNKKKSPKVTTVKGFSREKKSTLLVIFTTFHDVPSRDYINKNTVSNWANLGPYVKPVLFTDLSRRRSTLSVRTARKAGWLLLPMPKVSQRGVLPLRQMFTSATESVPDALFYGYCNAGTLFNSQLPATLEAISFYTHLFSLMNVVGDRTDILVDVKKESPKFTVDSVGMLAKGGGQPGPPGIHEYSFVTHPADLPWDKRDTKRRRMATVDATDTVLALHQVEHTTRHPAPLSDVSSTYVLDLPKLIEHLSRRTTHVNYVSLIDSSGSVVIKRDNEIKPEVKRVQKKVEHGGVKKG